MPHNPRKLLIDIALSCEEIIEFTKETDLEEFSDNRMLQLAIEREFEIIGEALSRLFNVDANNLENKIPDFRQIIDFRNIISHGYDVIDENIIWDFAKNKVPVLLKEVRNY